MYFFSINCQSFISSSMRPLLIMLLLTPFIHSSLSFPFLLVPPEFHSSIFFGSFLMIEYISHPLLTILNLLMALISIFFFKLLSLFHSIDFRSNLFMESQISVECLLISSHHIRNFSCC